MQGQSCDPERRQYFHIKNHNDLPRGVGMKHR